MRLEIETGSSMPPLTENVLDEKESLDSAEAKASLKYGIRAAQAGDRAKARASLLRAVELDPRSENGWLWLASISEYPEELLGFLNNVLEINPENERAREWRVATHSLLSKTFVQRGSDAVADNRKDLAVECFQKALEYDETNSSAWMWMASVAGTNSLKMVMLERALEFDPQNEDARNALADAKSAIRKERLAEARTAAVSGNKADAVRILDDILEDNPDSIDAWTMRAHLAESFEDKIHCFESILAHDPENVAARSARDSLLELFGTADAAEATDEAVSLSQPEPDSLSDASPVELVQELESAEVYEREAESVPEPVENCEPEPEKVFEPAENYHVEPEVMFEPVSEPAENLESEDAAAFPDDISYTEFYDDEEKLESSAEPFGSVAEETPAFSEAGDEPEHIAEPLLEYSPEVEPEAANGFHPEPAIPIPAEELPAPAEEAVVDEAFIVESIGTPCPFCGNDNDEQAISCHSCRAVLTLSDLELLLANQNADKAVLRTAVEEMERQRLRRDFAADELVTLALGHLNLRNLLMGYCCLHDASKLDPNNVVLAGQVHALLIRVEEIKQQEEAHLRMPKGKSILVVDDSPTVRKLIAGKLEKSGHEVILAADGVEAMEWLDGFVPDLVLLDITMPRMDGYEVCKQIRSNSDTKDVPVVMISGKDGFFDKVRGRRAGSTGFITKPFGPETLMRAVEMYLSGEVPESEDV